MRALDRVQRVVQVREGCVDARVAVELVRAGTGDEHVVPGPAEEPVVPGAGSAIFLHVARPDFSNTEGCIAVSREVLIGRGQPRHEAAELEVPEELEDRGAVVSGPSRALELERDR